MDNYPSVTMQQMRASFAEQLPLRLDAVRKAVTTMLYQPWDVSRVVSAQRLVHSLIGASGTFGLAAIGLSARCLEDAIAPLSNRTDYPNDAECSAIRALLAQLEAQLITPGAPNGDMRRAASAPALRPLTHSVFPLIYIVEDDPEQAQMLSQLLAENYYRPRVFNALDEFRQACFHEPLPLAIIMDMIFPEGMEAGAQTIAELKYQYLDGLPVIFVSVRDDLQARLAAFRAGASCYLHKPVQAEKLLHILNTIAVNIPQTPYQVLLVDDDPHLLEFHAEILRHAGMLVRTLCDPLKTLEVLHEFKADVLLLDVYMPGCQGTELAAVIREQEDFVNLPILFLSVETDIRKQLMALDFGGDDFLVKPVNPVHLVMVVKVRAQRMRRLAQMIDTLNESLQDFMRAQQLQQSNSDLRIALTLSEQSEQELCVVAAAFETQDAIMITDRYGNILRVNRSFQEITGYTADEVLGQNPRLLKSGRHDEAFYKEMWGSLIEQGRWSGEIWDKRKTGVIYPKWMTVNAVRNSMGLVSHYVSVFRDISEAKHAEEEIRNLAFYDQLTGLPNRRLLLDRLRTAQFASDRSQQHGALMFIDLDKFKVLNDTHGHAVGDLMLVEVACRMLACVREVDTVARFGGDEFVVLLGDLSKDISEAAIQAGAVAEKIRQVLSVSYLLNSFEHNSTPSIGVTLFRAQEQSIDDLMKYADAAMYRAKTSGRNTVCFCDPEMQSALEVRAELEVALRDALPDHNLLIYYQIQVDNDRRITAVEALLRWNHPKLGLMAADQFMPLAEDSGLILPIGEWVLYSACEQLKRWRDDPLAQHLNLFVNISLRQIHQLNFVEQVKSIIEATGINPTRLKLEISERVVLYNFDATLAKIIALKDVGVRFAINDFGIGYSSLTYLRRLPLEYVKIDKSVIEAMTRDSGDDVMVKAINNIAQNFGLLVIAEGVETEAQLAILKLNACEAFQGYLFGKPVTLSEFEQLLRE